MSEKKNSFNREDLLACSRGEMFGPGNSQLPAPNMLMMDRVVSITEDGGEHGKGEIIAELDITPDLWFFDCHFPGDPVMPGCLGLDAMWQLVGFFLGWLGEPGKGRALGVNNVKFSGEVLNGIKQAIYEINVKRILKKEGTIVGLADGSLFADNNKIYEAENLKVGLFK